MKKNILINIQFLRAIAALMVVFYHVSGHFFATGGKNSGNFFSFMSQIGYMGVDIFFVISGYIMWHTTKHAQGIHDVLKFIYSRLTRIYPLYWSFFFLLTVMYWGKEKLDTVDIVGSFFLTTSSLGDMILTIAWTLQYELYFYLFFALLLFVTRKHRIKFLVFVFFTILLIQTYAIVNLDIYNKEHFYAISRLYLFWFSPFVVEFLLGSFVAYYFEHARIKYLMPLAIGIGVLTIGALYYQEYNIEGTLAQGYYMPQRVLFFGTLSMLLLAFVVELNKRKIILLEKIALSLGNASYSLYLSHIILLLVIYKLGIRDMIQDFGRYQGLWMFLIVVFLVLYSLLHYKLVELPLLRFSKKMKKTLFHN